MELAVKWMEYGSIFPLGILSLQELWVESAKIRLIFARLTSCVVIQRNINAFLSVFPTGSSSLK
ncbi:hypothetical protein SAMN05444392_1059 [Seinonella peptonophila]|uniref:Uncharacterized protein n=1 Tax=Seinonella peptonophila TaxID=112248 RepID=A0A1M4XH60_9BACL|nr:hypothetical protein SAMN05444392_1059 [Seinonella peptonophila]